MNYANITGDEEEGFIVQFGGRAIGPFPSLPHARLAAHQVERDQFKVVAERALKPIAMPLSEEEAQIELERQQEAEGDQGTAYAQAESELRGFHWAVALPLSLWCLLWLVANGYSYFRATWHLLEALRWGSFALLINPCFWIWVVVFSSSFWAPLNLVLMPWAKFGSERSRTKATLMIVFVPVVLALGLEYVGPYFYPLIPGGESGGCFLRLIPVLGGKGYN